MTGTISRSAILEALVLYNPFVQYENVGDIINTIMRHADLGRNGQIDYTTWLMLTTQTAWTENQLIVAFKYFDHDQDEIISGDDLRHTFANWEVSKKLWQEIVDEVGSDICFDVFKHMMLSLCEPKFEKREYRSNTTQKTHFNSRNIK